MNQQPAELSARTFPAPYADLIICNSPDRFDAVEIHPVAMIDAISCETVDPEDAEFWSAYLHLKTGGVECIGDFESEEEAASYALSIAAQHGYRAGFGVMDQRVQ